MVREQVGLPSWLICFCSAACADRRCFTATITGSKYCWLTTAFGLSSCKQSHTGNHTQATTCRQSHTGSHTQAVTHRQSHTSSHIGSHTQAVTHRQNALCHHVTLPLPQPVKMSVSPSPALRLSLDAPHHTAGGPIDRRIHTHAGGSSPRLWQASAGRWWCSEARKSQSPLLPGGAG